ncbi:polysaccharide deacetylase family protein [Vagococcus fluvialis]|uniref:polysaccharide deacetylase family protein n=1 Tax=Vagococcus fluvialis TaxID=2738 RepID=UPI00288E10F6|nr:polysaccharide deacetylase family protein [Vagococcus fluvialis]MDT2781043.1 polysaccharide deacetylase family protein [Vagococcus fluvialis]
MTQKEKQVIYLLLTVLLLVVVSVSSFLAVKIVKNKESSLAEKEEVILKPKETSLDQANELVSGYYYDKALELLETDSSEKATELKARINELVKTSVHWDDPGKIPHLFFHSLIKDPKKAFDSAQNGQGYKDYMVTIEEFKRSIEELYKNGYVLVSLEKLVQKNSNNELEFAGVNLPQNKKPLVLSQDDVSYYEYMTGEGFPDKLVLDTNQEVKNLYSDNGNQEIGDFDMIPLIDSFVKEHPDFSYQGAKGMIALTGYNGVLGYRTSPSVYGDNEKTKEEKEEAIKVAKKMKATGWTFASHSWGHIDMDKSTLEDIQRDNQLWQEEVAPIVGKTSVFIYPFGADINDWLPYEEDENKKFAYLKEQGFDIYCNVDATQSSWGQFDNDFYRNSRINVDGIRFESELTGENTVLNAFFNTKDVIDEKTRE